MSASRAWVVRAFVLDLLATLLFAIIGRASHHEGVSLIGLLETWWPFTVALVVGWLITSAWRRPTAVPWPGVGIWLVTVAGGMLLRLATGQGTAVGFIVVASIALGLLLVGWRGTAGVVRRRTAKHPSTDRPKTERYS